ncbi:6-O-methylguanine DNA methyltransferase, DNA binding domain protein [Marvinbryantia formatexigens DSM 14469]|uniref:Methylated-DNA--protein-cysteine methyltransferase n=1 Tax=Marvinbryantia formatexigens DSM 14469 TaxID=478749 RepID=C6LH34_9FIRM|nr:methylated-DNA--[protein]-cysteine S-methyltransferase [Marvinbryantia formatexigens]EET60093.1 6-O-methylguanine DNA methyltransferase, DNA binding domain protein [Marvinbryantia formatexigens DSM 14469]UWO23881.1 methylated-DNA--[protein]-cysteine S-methyltransferase [Marvinbryantia formatexigens DSM 14469]SDG51669.1 O-6-methylguanine DNA methyltransferase [Marvinbryantia formatexigens]
MKEEIYFYQAPFGRLTLASDGEALTGLWIDGQKYDRATLTQPYETSREQLCAPEIQPYETPREQLCAPEIQPYGAPLEQMRAVSPEQLWGAPPVIADTMRWLDIYFSGKQPDFLPPLRPKGSAFRQEVWKILLKIPYGETTTYKKIAGEIAAAHGRSSMSAQAVGGAVGHNPISILIPCHRVLGTDGSLTGYAGGLTVKGYLLRLEGYLPGEIKP